MNPLNNAGALSGITVLEIGSYIAGPYAGTILGDLGARIIKIEEPSMGDVVRDFEPKLDGVSAAFLQLNRNKESIAIDLKLEAGKEIFQRLVGEADVVIENLRPGSMARLGFDYESIKQLNPRIIMLSASGWGQDGPLANDAGLDIMAQARSGLMSITGEPGGPPAKAGVPVCDIGCALYGAIGVLAALQDRNNSGEGQHIDVSLFETGVSYSIWEFAKYTTTGEVPVARGAVHQTAAPYQAIRAQDGWMTIGAATPKTWERFTVAFALEWMKTDPRFITNDVRMKNREELIAEIEAVSLTKPTSHWLEVLSGASVPAAPINSYDSVYDDENLKARDFFWEAVNEEGRSTRQMGSPIRLSRTPTLRTSAGPELGQNGTQILREIGHSEQDIESLINDGVVRVPAVA